MSHIKLIECPRDAMQGIRDWIPTELKVEYINALLRVGFDTIDFGSFVSPKAIPQMKDTALVLEQLNLDQSTSKLLAIVANERGARDAAQFEQIHYLGYPFSISETFQLRNTNATIEESLERVADIQSIAIKNGKELVIYISMGFGNPYGDSWNVDIVEKWVFYLYAMGIRIFSLSDTIGVSSPDSITYLFENLIPRFRNVEFGAHLHTTPTSWEEKINAAFEAGCRRYDGAIKGYGGCPMAKDELTGNMPMDKIIEFLRAKDMDSITDQKAYTLSLSLCNSIFNTYH